MPPGLRGLAPKPTKKGAPGAPSFSTSRPTHLSSQKFGSVHFMSRSVVSGRSSLQTQSFSQQNSPSYWMRTHLKSVSHLVSGATGFWSVVTPTF